MRILLIGQAAFGAEVLARLVVRSEDVVAVYVPPDGPGGRTDPLKEAAIREGINVFQPRNYRDDRVYAQFQALKPDLSVMAFVTDIIPSRLLGVPTFGSICYHPSLLPRHRGASAINWAVIMGDTQTGLSIFWTDAGIDTGPILLQKTIDIGADDTTGSIYFNRLFPMGVDALVESVELIRAGHAPREVQDEALATYEPPCDDRAAGIDWEKPAQDVYNLIRGCDPQPGAFTVHKGGKVRFYGAKAIGNPVDRPPGTITHIKGPAIHVSVLGGQLMIGKIRSARLGKIPAGEYASEAGLKEGDRFGQ